MENKRREIKILRNKQMKNKFAHRNERGRNWYDTGDLDKGLYI